MTYLRTKVQNKKESANTYIFFVCNISAIEPFLLILPLKSTIPLHCNFYNEKK